jgi:hypothetical protein
MLYEFASSPVWTGACFCCLQHNYTETHSPTLRTTQTKFAASCYSSCLIGKCVNKDAAILIRMNLSSLPTRRSLPRDFISVQSCVFLGETVRNQTGRTFSCRQNCQFRDRPFLHWHSFNKLRNWRNCQFITNSMEQAVSWKVNTRPDYRRVHKILRLALSSIRWIQSTPCLLKQKKKNSMVWVRERTITTERPPLVSEVIANLCG